MQLGLYLDRDTIAHRLHPGVKILCLLLFFVAALAFTHPAYSAVILAVAALLTSEARAVRSVVRVKVFLVLLFVFSTVLWTLCRGGSTLLFQMGPLRVTREAFFYGLGLGLRVDAMLVVGVVFLACTTVEAFVAGLRWLLVPYPLTFALGLAFRFVPLLFATTATVVKAQRSRGLDLERGGPLVRVRKYLPLLVPIFVATVRSTNALAMALEARAFSPGESRTSVQTFEIRLADWVALALFVVFACLSLGIVAAHQGRVPLP